MDEERQKLFRDTNVEDEETDDNKNPHTIKDRIKGVTLALFMTFIVGTSAVCVPLLERKIPDFELNSLRSGTSWILISIGLIITKQLPRVPKSEIVGLLLFSVNAVITPVSAYIAVSLIPLSYYKSLFFTFTIITGLVVFPIFLGERTDLKSVFFGLFCIIGVVLCIQPDFIFTWKKKMLTSQSIEKIADTFSGNFTQNPNVTIGSFAGGQMIPWNSKNTVIGCCLASLAGAADNVYIILLKKRPFLQENVLPVLFWTLTFSTTVCLLSMVIFEEPVVPKSTKQVSLITIHSLSFIISWASQMVATKYISGNTINIIYSTLIVLMLIPQYTLLKHILPGNHNWIEVLGSVLVFIGATTGSIWDVVKAK